ncbi:MAG: LamG domain-containing protein [Planctomycetota bacterium]
MKFASLFGLSLAALPSLTFAQTTLLGHYKLDETSGTVCMDSSGLGNHGTYMNGVVLGQAGVSASSGTAVDFDGTSGYVEIPGNAAFDALRDNLSIAAWIETDVVQLQRVFANDRPTFTAANSGSWAFGTTNVGTRFTTLWVQDYNSTAPLNAGQWHHIAVTFDAAFVASFYVDGVLVGQVAGAAPSNPPAMTNRYLIGVLDPTAGTTPEWYDGRIDDVQLYGGVLSAADVQYLFQNPGDAIGSTLGTQYCTPAVPNTSGGPANTSVSGSISVAANNLTLECTGMPNNAFGFFLTSRSQGMIAGPGGSQGVLCLGGSIGRYVAPGQIKNSGGSGQISLTVNLTQHPTPNGLVQVLAGDTWNFTAWFRDSVGGSATSNFSDGLAVTFLQ